MDTLLELRRLTKRFGGLTAVEEVSFDVRRGEILGLIGPNGAGKTTIFNLITGFYPPSEGEVFLEGALIAHPPPRLGQRLAGRARPVAPHRITARGIGRTFQAIRLFRTLTALENVMAGLHPRTRAGVWDALLRPPRQRAEEAAIRAEAERLLERMQLQDYRGELAKNLPYGHQRRLELARALATRPQLLALDEPAAGLNEQETAELADMISGIRDGGITILLIEHDMRMVMRLCERIVVLDHGRKIATGTPAEVCRDPEVICAYLGAEETPAPDAGSGAKGADPGTPEP